MCEQRLSTILPLKSMPSNHFTRVLTIRQTYFLNQINTDAKPLQRVVNSKCLGFSSGDDRG